MKRRPFTEVELARDAISDAATRWGAMLAMKRNGADSAMHRFDLAVNAFEDAVRAEERASLSAHLHQQTGAGTI